MTGSHHHQRDHDHSHSHGHDSHHDNNHGAAPDFTRTFAIGTGINFAYLVIEAIAGFLTGSMALLADAGHNLGDVLGLLLAWGAAVIAKRPPTIRQTYGLRRGTILAALANALIIASAAGGLAVESISRIFDPREIPGITVTLVAAAGVIVNGGSALLFLKGRHHDLNVRAAYIHLAADAAISVGVVVTGLGIAWSGWYWLDPMVGAAVSLAILWNAWSLLRESMSLAMDAVPAGVDPESVKQHLLSLPGVTGVHDLHIWAISTTETALTAHVVIPESTDGGDGFISRVSSSLRERFAIGHATLQVETGECPAEQKTCQVSD